MGILYRLVVNQQKQESKKDDPRIREESVNEPRLREYDVPNQPPIRTESK